MIDIKNSPSLLGSSQRLGGLITLQREDEALAEGRSRGESLSVGESPLVLL